MSRKVYIDFAATVLVPVKIKGEMTLRADDNASIDKAVKLWAKGQRYGKADVEDVRLHEVLEVNGFDADEYPSSALEDGIQEELDCSEHEIRINYVEVIDSK